MKIIFRHGYDPDYIPSIDHIRIGWLTNGQLEYELHCENDDILYATDYLKEGDNIVFTCPENY